MSTNNTRAAMASRTSRVSRMSRVYGGRRRQLLLLLLTAAVIASSFSVVITRHSLRMAFAHAEELFRQKDELHTRWESLQLEYGTLRTGGRVEALATSELGMKVPSRKEVVTLILLNKDQTKGRAEGRNESRKENRKKNEGRRT